MDNWSIYKTKSVKTKFVNSHIKVLFPPCYTPQLAPIENWFVIIKNKPKVRKQNKSKSKSKNKLIDNPLVRGDFEN